MTPSFLNVCISPGLAEWYKPTGGMFLWLKIIGLEDTRHLVATRCLEKLLILAPGYAFVDDVDSPSPFVRLSYSIATPEEIDRVFIFIFFNSFTIYRYTVIELMVAVKLCTTFKILKYRFVFRVHHCWRKLFEKNYNRCSLL